MDDVRWMIKAPTLEGFYFVEIFGELTGRTVLKVCHCYYSNPANPEMSVFMDGENNRIGSSMFKRFSTRIPKPKE